MLRTIYILKSDITSCSSSMCGCYHWR